MLDFWRAWATLRTHEIWELPIHSINHPICFLLIFEFNFAYELRIHESMKQIIASSRKRRTKKRQQQTKCTTRFRLEMRKFISHFTVWKSYRTLHSLFLLRFWLERIFFFNFIVARESNDKLKYRHPSHIQFIITSEQYTREKKNKIEGLYSQATLSQRIALQFTSR